MREVELIGVPCDFGAGRRGVDMGPSALRYAGQVAGRAEPEPRLRHLAEVLAMSR